jgi:hypothetical protein
MLPVAKIAGGSTKRYTVGAMKPSWSDRADHGDKIYGDFNGARDGVVAPHQSRTNTLASMCVSAGAAHEPVTARCHPRRTPTARSRGRIV